MREVRRPSSRPLGAARSAICNSASAVRKSLRDETEPVAPLFFQSDDPAHQVAPLVPCLQHQAAVPFGHAPLIRHQQERFFTGIQHGGLGGGGDETLDYRSQIGIGWGRHAL